MHSTVNHYTCTSMQSMSADAEEGAGGSLSSRLLAQVLPARQGPCPEWAGEAALGGPGHRHPGHHSQDRRDPSQGPERQLCGGAGHTWVPDHCQDEHGLLPAGL